MARLPMTYGDISQTYDTDQALEEEAAVAMTNEQAVEQWQLR